jgi:hypothetical protein
VFDTGQSQAQILANVQTKLSNFRAALLECANLYSWSSGISSQDLVGIGFSAADADALLTAINDAHAEYLIHTTGVPPSTYPQPASGYVYMASQNAVIGP